ncbi:MAG TPA: DUF1385 domain-containing protein [Candidatus Faeciplasma pullistercoris]|uniref:DUF1385 domain-containing protein n=1 Tax=Candidatus Faeciplasma pullistercoris TaxID=2840800 RepID=A0A9D1GSI0_9FIRM|nr:DUF1385 domain-containing protein [Candidatus Faeciplasma pullistercoris]
MSDKNSCKGGCKFKSKIGGQALIEGIMMRGIDTEAMAVRLPDGSIDLEQWKLPKAKWYQKTPFVRGPVNFVTTLIDGYKCLSKSADKSLQEENENPSKLEKWLEEKLGDKLMSAVMFISGVLGVALALALFIYLPALATRGLAMLFPGLDDIYILKNVIEGVIKIGIFILYIWLTSLLKDIRRTYEYHGAEHKTIACYEAGDELTVENVKKHTRFHPRCGTSFIFLVLFISIIVNTLFMLPWEQVWLRALLKLCVLPIIVSIAYEVIKLNGKYDNIITKIISAPGLWIQRLTTREPDDSQIEVALAAFIPCIPEDKEQDRW